MMAALSNFGQNNTSSESLTSFLRARLNFEHFGLILSESQGFL